VSSDEDDYDCGSDGNDFDVSEDISDGTNPNGSPESSPSVEDVLNSDSASQIQKTSPTLAVDTPGMQASATNVETATASQLGKGRGIQAIESEMFKAGRLPESEEVADSITVVVDDMSLGAQRQHTSTDEIPTWGQRLVELANAVSWIQKEHEKLEREEAATQSRLAKTMEEYKTAFLSFRNSLSSEDDSTSELEIAQAKLSALQGLDKKRKIERAKCQVQQAKRKKFEANVGVRVSHRDHDAEVVNYAEVVITTESYHSITEPSHPSRIINNQRSHGLTNM